MKNGRHIVIFILIFAGLMLSTSSIAAGVKAASLSPIIFTLQERQTHSIGDWTAFDVVAGDVNGDGRTDLIFSATTTEVNVARIALARTSGDGFDLISLQILEESDWSAYDAVAGDVNGDGRADLIFSKRASNRNVSRVALARTSGDGFDLQNGQILEYGNWSAYDVMVGDVNGDSQDDPIFSKRTTQENVARVALAQTDGDGFDLQNGQILEQSDWSLYDALAGDVNGDGRADLIFSKRSNLRNVARAALARVSGDGFDLQNGQILEQSNWSAYDAATGDFNRDARADLVFSKQSAQRLVARVALARTGGDGFDLRNGHILAEGNWSVYNMLTGDVNGDGRTDLIFSELSAARNRTYVALADGWDVFLPIIIK
jgi:hypothetical protein